MSQMSQLFHREATLLKKKTEIPRKNLPLKMDQLLPQFEFYSLKKPNSSSALNLKLL